MTLPHAVPEPLRFDREAFERFFASPLSPTHWVSTRLHDTDHLPDGAALLVGNHGPLGMDTPLLSRALYEHCGRAPRSLGDRLAFRVPPARKLARAIGAVEGTPDNALTLLQAGEWVLVYPGGVREAQRGNERRYTLSWEGRLGFVRVALRARVPIVPVACVGNDDAFVRVRSREQMSRTLPGRWIARWLGPDYVPPLLLPVLKKLRFDYYFGEPITLGEGDPEDSEHVQRQQQRVRTALEELVHKGLAQSAGDAPVSRTS